MQSGLATRGGPCSTSRAAAHGPARPTAAAPLCSTSSRPCASTAPAIMMARASSPAPGLRTRAPLRLAPVSAGGQWQTFGPSASHMDGDAEFYQLSNRLAQQHPGFAPTSSIQPEQQAQAELASTSEEDIEEEVMQELRRTRPEFGLTERQIQALGLSGPRLSTPDSASLSSRNFIRGEKFDPDNFRLGTARGASGGGGAAGATMAGRSGGGARAAYGDYPNYPEGRPLFWPESARYGNPPDLPSLLLQQRVIYVSMPFVPSVTELLVAQCYYLDFDDRNRQKPIYVYLNSTGCMNDKGQAIAADNEFYAIWAALGFTRAPLYTGVTWKAQNQAAVLLSAGQKGHRYTFPHAKISTAPPILNRVFGQTVDAQLQSNQLEYATKYYAAILSRATGKPLAQCQKEFLSRRRYFSVKEAYEEGLVDKLVPGYSLNRFQKMRKEIFGEPDAFYNQEKPRFRFKREDGPSA